MPRVKEGLEVEIKPLPIRQGIIHLHYVLTRPDSKVTSSGRWEWIVRQRHVHGICGTKRCVMLEVKTNTYAVTACQHDWRPAPWGTFQCGNCHEYRIMEVDTSNL